MYLTGQHNVVPEQSLVENVTHVALAFMQASTFNDVNPEFWPIFTDVMSVRAKFAIGTSIMVAIGGWGDTENFSTAAATEESRKHFADNVRRMIDQTGADGVDIDWEYPGGNGEDYKQKSNADKAWEVDAYPKLLQEIRTSIGPHKLISAAVPGLHRDMLAFTKSTLPAISASVEFLNIMTYDLMNRRDHITKHHTGLVSSLDAVGTYIENGLPESKVNLGFAFYVKWFRTSPSSDCNLNPIGCSTLVMEDPLTGADLGRAGAFAWSDPIPPELTTSFGMAMMYGEYDAAGGGHYYHDDEENIFWSWDDPKAIQQKLPKVMEQLHIGGVFVWGLGEDSGSWSHLISLNNAFKRLQEDAQMLTRSCIRNEL